MTHPLYWLFAGLCVAICVFTFRLVIKAQRRARLERAARAVDQETIPTPPDIG
jgi:hypothetical protein